MRLPKEKSKNVVEVQRVNRMPKGDRQDATYTNPDGKGASELLYKSPQFRRAIEDVSSEFQSRTRRDGKGDHPNESMNQAMEAMRRHMKMNKP